MKIEGSIALVTGANRGLGKALVAALVEAGATKVYAAARDARQIAAGPRIVPLTLDITQPAQVAAAAANANDVTLLVNNAGVCTSFDVLTAAPSELDADFRTNVHGTLAVVRAFIPVLERARGGATIVNVHSLASLAAVPPMGGYASSKAAAYSMTQALRAGLKAKGIAVLAALPGPIETDMTKGLDLPKSAAADVASTLLAGVERGDEEIFPDRMSLELSALWRSSPKDLERALANAGVSFSTSFTVRQSPDEVFAAISDPRRWWSQAIDGDTARVGARWTYRYQNFHRANFRVTELVPGRRVVWHVEENHFDFVKDTREWTGNDLVFAIERVGDDTVVRFTQYGLVPEYECYDVCATAWTTYVTGSLKNLITSGRGQPNPIESVVAHARAMRAG